MDFNDISEQPVTENKYQVEDIKARLLANIQSVLSYLLPSGKFQHDRFVIGDVQGKPGKSLVVTLTGDKAGVWHDFNTGEGGDLFSLWANIYGLDIKNDFTEVLQDIEGWLGGSYVMQHSQEPKKPTPPIDELGAFTAKWDYFDANNQLIACVYRYDPEGGKEFRPWDVKTRKYQAPNPRPLYNQPGMIGASQVILVEGEKSAQSLINIGICATTAMNGARAPVDKTDWSPLAGKEVFIWPDKDKPGWEYAESVAGVLKEAGVTKLYILYPREEWPEKYDAADAVMEGLDIKAFLTDAKRLEFKTNNSFLNIYDWRATRYQGDAPEQKFLVANIFPLGVVSILAAMGDTGKGMLTLNLALQVAIGEQPENSINQQPLSFGSIIQAFGTAVIFTAEDDQNEIHRRLERLDPQRQRLKRPDKLMVIPLPNAGGTFPLVAITKEGFEATKQYKAIKEQLLKIADLKLIVFDPLSSFIHADVNADPAAGSYSTGLLASLASETTASLIIAHHMRKPTGGKPITSVEQARDAIRGTSALVDGVRTAYALWPAPPEHQYVVFKSLNENFIRNAVFQGAVVKSNSPADRTMRTYLRSDTGLLVDITLKLKENAMPLDQLKELLITAIGRSARNGHPFTHTGGSGIYKQRNRLPVVFHNIGRDRIEKIIQDLLNERPAKLVKGRSSGSKEDKWLDVPEGPFAKGLGEFEHGAEEVSE